MTKFIQYKRLILPVLLHGAEAWTLKILRAEAAALRVFEWKALRKIFGLVRADCSIRSNSELYELFNPFGSYAGIPVMHYSLIKLMTGITADILENNDTKPPIRKRSKVIFPEISKDEMKKRWTPVIAGIPVIWPEAEIPVHHFCMEKISDYLVSNS